MVAAGLWIKTPNAKNSARIFLAIQKLLFEEIRKSCRTFRLNLSPIQPTA